MYAEINSQIGMVKEDKISKQEIVGGCGEVICYITSYTNQGETLLVPWWKRKPSTKQLKCC